MSEPTWNVLRWESKPEGVENSISLICPKCQHEATMPMIGKHPIIAAIGLRLIFDPANYIPPKGFLPTAIQCRQCQTIFEA